MYEVMIMIILVLAQNSMRKALVFSLFMIVLYHLFGALDYFENLIKVTDPLYPPFKLMCCVNQQISHVALVDLYTP